MNKSALKILLIILGLGVATTVLWIQRGAFHLNPLEESLVLEWPSFTTSGPEGRTFTLDKSLKRVVAVDSDGTLAFVLTGGSREEGKFFFADEIAADSGGGLYLLNRIMDPSGFFTVMTEIQQYNSQGILLRTLIQKKWPTEERTPSLVQRGPWFGLGTKNNVVYWFEANPQGLNLWKGEVSGDVPKRTSILELPQADLLISSADLSFVKNAGNVVFYITKKGQIFRWQEGGEQELWYNTNQETTRALPWRLRADDQGGFIFTDLGRDNLFKVDSPGNLSPGLISHGETGDHLYISLSMGSDGRLGTVSDYGAFVLGSSGLEKVLDPTYPMNQKVWAWILWAILALGLILIFTLFWIVFRDVMKGKIPAFAKKIFSVIFLTVFIGGLVSYMVLDNFSKRYSAEVLNKISQLVNLVPRLIDSNALMALDRPEDFLSPEYLKIRSDVIQSIYGDNFERNEGLYFAIHRVNPDGRLYTFMWLNGEPSLWQPYSYLWDPELAYQASLKGDSQAYSALDAFGSWLLATAPIRDSQGQVVGVFEMGGDFYSFTQENNRLIQSLILNIATVLVLLLILMVEGTFLSDLNQRKHNQILLIQQNISPRRDIDAFHGVFITRPLAVILFTALSMSLLFLPLVMADMVKTLTTNASWLLSLGLPESVLLSLPLSVRLLFFGFGTLVAGSLTFRWGWKGVLGSGLVVALGGIVLSALSIVPEIFLLASGLLGFGTGLATIGLRSVINSESDPLVRNKSYAYFYAGLIAGTNVGVMAGQWLADFLGYQGVFWVSAVVVLISAWAVWRMGSSLPNRKLVEGLEVEKKSVSIWSLFGDRKVLVFFTAIILPIYVASMFLGYFLPVFSISQGLSNGDVGRIFLLNGLIIIYLGPPLVAALRRRIGAKQGVMLSTLVWALSLIPFLLLQDLTGLIWTIALMGLAEGLAVPYQNEYYLSLSGALKVGEDKATGVFEVVGKVGETIAPILIGFSLILGPVWGFSLVALTLLTGLVLFLITSIQRRTNEQK